MPSISQSLPQYGFHFYTTYLKCLTVLLLLLKAQVCSLHTAGSCVCSAVSSCMFFFFSFLDSLCLCCSSRPCPLTGQSHSTGPSRDMTVVMVWEKGRWGLQTPSSWTLEKAFALLRQHSEHIRRLSNGTQRIELPVTHFSQYKNSMGSA